MSTLAAANQRTRVEQAFPPPAPLVRPHMPELDSLRGTAILLVLFFHGLAPPLNAKLTPVAQALLGFSRYGWIGVNLFFVLSGFLITGILLDDRAKTAYFRRFYLRRALRILPAFCVTLALLLIGGWISWRFLALAVLFVANCAPLLGVPLQYGPLWSLAVEEHFYLLWPFLVRKLPVASLVVVLSVIVLLSPALRGGAAALSGDPQHFIPLYTWFNLDGLAIGALLAIWLRQPSCSRLLVLRFGWGAFLVGIAVFALVLHRPLAEAACLISGCNLASAGMLSLALWLGSGGRNSIFDHQFLKFLGYISYGLYLVHVLAFRLSEILLSRLWPLLISSWPTSATFLRFTVGSGLAIAAAWLSRSTLEERFLRLKPR